MNGWLLISGLRKYSPPTSECFPLLKIHTWKSYSSMMMTLRRCYCKRPWVILTYSNRTRVLILEAPGSSFSPSTMRHSKKATSVNQDICPSWNFRLLHLSLASKTVRNILQGVPEYCVLLYWPKWTKTFSLKEDVHGHKELVWQLTF